MQTPILLLAVSFVAGILLGQGFLFFPWTALAVLSLCAGAGAFAVRVKRAPGASLLLAAAGALAGAVALVQSAANLPDDHFTRIAPPDGTVREISGRITSPLERDPDRTAFVLEAAAIGGIRTAGSLRVVVRDPSPAFGTGDHVTITGKLHPPRGYRNPGGFDYPAFLARHGMHAVLSVRSSDAVRVDQRGSGVLRALQDLRERIRQALLMSVSGDGAAVLLAMVLGEEGGLSDDLRDRFMKAGVTHILSISGSHLGLVALLCFWAVRQALFLLPERAYHRLTLAADPRKIAALFTMGPVAFYAFLAGGQVATVRSLIMILAGLTAVVLDREGDLLAALTLSALITLVPDPQALFDISFQLSYLSVLCIAWLMQAWQKLGLPAGTWPQRLRNHVLLLLLISLGAALATGPLVAWYFNQLSLAGVAANMVVVPFAGALVVPLGLISGVLSLLTGSIPFAPLNQSVADAFVGMVSFFSSLPFAAVPVPAPGIAAAAGFTGLLFSAARWLRDRLLHRLRPLEFTARPPRAAGLVMVASLSLLILAAVLSLVRDHPARTTFLDVGQGDCALIEGPDGRTILVDGGGTRDGRFDIGRRIVAPFLWNRGIRTLDLVILSHPHPDHLNGLLFVLRAFRVREVWTSGQEWDGEGAERLRRQLAELQVPLRNKTAGDSAWIGSVLVEVLHPHGGYRPRGGRGYAAENSRSLVVRIVSGGMSFLFPGDIHQDAEQALIASRKDLSADIVKVPHHGSRTSSSDAFVAAVRPRGAVVSVGAGNPYRQPSDDAMARYTRRGAVLCRTDQDGAVIVSSGEVLAWARTDLVRISPGELRQWAAVERENGRRLRIRKGAI